MSPQPISDRSEKKGCGRVGMGVFGSLFLIAGLISLWFILIVPLLKWQAAKNWVATECKITAAKLESHRSDDGTSYSAKFTYQYTVDGEQFSCSENSLFEVNGSRRGAKAKLKQHPVGSTTTCFYDPADPSQALLNRELTWGMLFGLLPLVFILVGGSILASSILGWGWGENSKDARRLKSIESPSSDRDMRMGITTASNLSAISNTDFPADEEDRIWDVPQKLAPETTRLVSLLVTIGVALFWNGLVSVFVYVVIYEMEGIIRIFVGLFLVPFVLVGLMLIVACFHTFLALFNPKIEIGLSTGAVPIGGEVDVAWQVSGFAGRIRTLKISVVGTQEATYRRGTDSVTDKEVFEKIVLAEASNAQDIQFGSTTLKIPDDVMHTFEAEHNQVVWSFEIHGEIPWWPDIQESYPFRVKPAEV